MWFPEHLEDTPFNKVVFAFKFKPKLNLMFDPKDNLRV